jgi:hypothetical protein
MIMAKLTFDATPLGQPLEPITVLHRMYERAWQATGVIEKEIEEARESEKIGDTYRWNVAMTANQREASLLQLALLYQVPTTWRDALILAHHVRELQGHVATGAKEGTIYAVQHEWERDALDVGLTALLDFLACELPDEDHEEIGPMFKASTMHAWNSRRARTGAED